MSNDYDQRLAQLVEGLITRTTRTGETDALNWDAIDDDTFELNLKSSSIRVSSADNDGVSPFVLEILDENGRTVELVDEKDSGRSGYHLDRLYRAASRNYRKTDAKLNEILGELGIREPAQRPKPPVDDPWGTDEPPF